MSGRPPAPVDERNRLRRDILSVRGDQLAWEHQLTDYIAAEVRALALLDSARAGQQLAKRHVEECGAAISSLQDELARVPRQGR